MKTLIDNIIALAVAALCTFLISIATLPFNSTGMASRYIYDLMALPGLCGDFSLSGNRVEVEAAEVEENVGLEALAGAIAAGFLDQ